MEMKGITPVILGFLSFGERSGYEIKADVDKSTRFFWAGSYGQIYPELRRLEKAGLVEGESRPHGERQRTVYRITDAGRDALRGWLVSPSAKHELRHEMLLKLFFAQGLGNEGAREVVGELRTVHQDTVDRLREIEDFAKSGGTLTHLVLEFGLAVHGAALEWCDAAEARLLEEAKGGA